jgi:hypothetical protein
VTVSTVNLDIAGGSPHKVHLTGQFSADCEGGTGGIVVLSILIDGNLTLDTQINNLEGNTGTLLYVSGVASLTPGTHRLDLSAFVTNLQSITAHHRSLSAVDLDADVRCVENIASLRALPAGVVPCLTVLGYLVRLSFAPKNSTGSMVHFPCVILEFCNITEMELAFSRPKASALFRGHCGSW